MLCFLVVWVSCGRNGLSEGKVRNIGWLIVLFRLVLESWLVFWFYCVM